LAATTYRISVAASAWRRWTEGSQRLARRAPITACEIETDNAVGPADGQGSGDRKSRGVLQQPRAHIGVSVSDTIARGHASDVKGVARITVNMRPRRPVRDMNAGENDATTTGSEITVKPNLAGAYESEASNTPLPFSMGRTSFDQSRWRRRPTNRRSSIAISDRLSRAEASEKYMCRENW